MLVKFSKDLNDMLFGYYGLKLPAAFIECLLNKNPEFITELQQGCICDTAVREDVIDAILKDLGMRSWPTYGDIKKYPSLMETFYSNLKTKVDAIGGTFDMEEV